MENKKTLSQQYFEMFGEPPIYLVTVSKTHPKYIEMLEYCVENGVKTTNEVINKFFDSSKMDVVEQEVGEQEQADKLFGL